MIFDNNNIFFAKSNSYLKKKNIINYKIFQIYCLLNILIKIVSTNYSEVELTIEGKNGIEFHHELPSKIIVNNINYNYSDKVYSSDLNDGLNTIKIIWNCSITNCYYMFAHLPNLRSIDLSKLDTSEVTTMNGMFLEFGLTSLDLSNFKTSKVTDMNSMFSECIELKSLNLNNFDTSKVTDMSNMFYGCIELESLNINSFNTKNVTKLDGMFDGTWNLVICFNESKAPNLEIPTNIENNCGLICYDKVYFICLDEICPENFSKLIEEKKLCINDCSLDDTYKNEYNNKCYKENRLNSTDYIYNENTNYNDDIFLNSDKEIISDEFINTEQSEDKNSYDLITEITNKEYSSYNSGKELEDSEKLINIYTINNLIDIIEELSIYNNNTIVLNNNDIDKILGDVQDLFTNIDSDEIISKLIDGEDIIFLDNNNVSISLTSTENQNNNNYKNETSIDLGECEGKLKEEYNISNNESLIIYKVDFIKDNWKIPRIEYEVYYPLYDNKLTILNLTLCKNMQIFIRIPMTINNNKKDIDKHNISSDYYNGICYKETSEKGTDITLNDRKELYLNNEMNPCEENCRFEEYEKNNKKAICSCNVKTEFNLFSEVRKNKTLLIIGFKGIKTVFNLNVLKCYHALFNIYGILYNIGFYLLLVIIIFHLISIIIFYKKDNKIIKNKISNIVYAITNSNIINNKKLSDKKLTNLEENDNKIKSPPIKKIKIKKYSTNKKYSSNSLKTNNIIIEDSKNILNFNPKDKNINKLILEYNINELNNLNYNEALKKDKRTYYQYYLSLLKTKHILLFSFCSINDYNSKIIKILLFFLSFAINISVNALFFNDSTIHKLYIDDGKYNILYQIPKIIYSLLITTFFNSVLKLFALSEDNILKLKMTKEKNSINDLSKNILKKLFYKFLSFFIISFLFLFLFWYYLSSFCAVYENSQIHLIKDTLISFSLSMIYSLGIYLIPGIFRIPSLRSNKREKLYRFSKIIQLI